MNIKSHTYHNKFIFSNAADTLQQYQVGDNSADELLAQYDEVRVGAEIALDVTASTNANFKLVYTTMGAKNAKFNVSAIKLIEYDEVQDSYISWICNEDEVGGGDCRFGYNGQNKDNEIKGIGNSLDFKFRVYDSRLGRFLSVDPLFASYPHNSTYAFAENRVIDGIDLEGAERFYTADGKLIGKYGTSKEVRVVRNSEVAKNVGIVLAYAHKNPAIVDNFVKKNPAIVRGAINKHSTEAHKDRRTLANQWGNEVNRESIKNNREFSSNIYNINVEGEQYKIYTEPKMGTIDGANPSLDPPPNGIPTEAYIHAHGAYDSRYDNNNFSDTPGDKAYGRFYKQDGYVTTPDGSLKEFDYKTNTEKVINTDMPSDRNDPDRKNTKD